MRASIRGLLAVAIVLGAPRATAQESHVHAVLGLGHAVGDPQARELGWGAAAGLAYELRLATVVGFEAGLDVYDLSQGSPPANPAFAPRGQGFGADALLGARVRPLATMTKGGLWLEVQVGAGVTGSAVRPVLEGRAGYDLFHIEALDWQLGPMVEYMQVFQPSNTVRPEDAHLLWAGVHIDFTAHATAPPRTDRDEDGVFDDEDACPDVRGLRTSDPRTNGCPPPPPVVDRDADGVPDSDDVCPEVPGVASEGARKGCPPPPPDRDRDSIADSDDACPDVRGIKTADVRTNGCPLPPDRDKDGVLDGDDACPDVPGVHTDDPKSNGCPKATEAVRVEGDQILLTEIIHFETGSPRVRHASWGIVKKIADFIRSNPDIEEVDIEGHADEVGTDEYNLYLSRERGESVKRLLIHFGVDPKKVVAHAYGESRPRQGGHDEKARSENRRVEFTITRAREGTTPAQPQAPSGKPGGGP